MDFKNKYIKYKLKYLNLLNEYKLNGGDEEKDTSLEKKSLNTESDIGVINFKFIDDIINKRVTYKINNSMIYFIIYVPAFLRSSIKNNTLSIPGTSIYLDNKYDDEYDTAKIHKIIDNKEIIAKHIIDIPYSNKVEGVLLSDLLKYLKLTKINTEKFGIIINLTNKDYLEKIKEKIYVKDVPLIKLKNDDIEYTKLNLDDSRETFEIDNL